MKTLILIVGIFIFPLTASALWGYGEKEEVKIKEPEKPSICHYSIDIGKGVLFIFQGGCEEFKHVGIIDVRKNKIIILDDSLEKEFDSNFTTPNARADFTEKKWKGLTPVKYGDIKD